MAVENWVFFGVNAIFTAFNAWMAWQNWKRAAASDRPALSIAVRWSPDVAAVEVEIAANNGTTVLWRAVQAELRRPAGENLHTPRVLTHQNAFGEEIHVPVLPVAGEGRRLVRLVGRTDPNVNSREIVWVTGAGPNDTIELKLTYESGEPQPRRHTAKVTRTVPAFTAVMTT